MGDRRCRSSVIDVAVVLLILAYVAALMPTLTRFPAPINDEGREANLFWVASGAEPGAVRMNAHRGFSTWGTGGLQGATAAMIFRLGGVGVFQARLTSLLWGGILLVLVYLLGRLYWDRAVGVAAAALLAVSNPFLLSTHTLRPDIQVATLVVAALLLAELSMTRARGWAALAAGVLLGLSIDTHLNSIAFIPLVTLVFVLRAWHPGTAAILAAPRAAGSTEEIRSCRDIRAVEMSGLAPAAARIAAVPGLWLFILGLTLAALYYLAVRVLPDPAGFATAMGYWLGVDKAPPAARGGLGIAGMVGNELARYWDYFGEEPLELALVLVSLGAGAWWAIRGGHPARVIMLGLLAAFVFFVAAVSMKSKYYMLLTYPFYMLLVARVMERLAAFVGRRRTVDGGRTGVLSSSLLRRPSAVAGQAALALLVVAVAWWPLKFEERAWDNYIQARRYREGQDYLALTARLDALAGPGARILAPPVYWIGLKEHPFVDIFVYERLYRQHEMSPTQFLDEVQPDFVIADAKIATDRQIERMLYRELDRRAPYELIVRHKNFGDVAVYRLRDHGR